MRRHPIDLQLLHQAYLLGCNDGDRGEHMDPDQLFAVLEQVEAELKDAYSGPLDLIPGERRTPGGLIVPRGVDL